MRVFVYRIDWHMFSGPYVGAPCGPQHRSVVVFADKRDEADNCYVANRGEEDCVSKWIKQSPGLSEGIVSEVFFGKCKITVSDHPLGEGAAIEV